MHSRTGGHDNRGRGLGRRHFLAALALGFLIALAACGGSSTESREGDTALEVEADLAVVIGELAGELALTDEQKEALRDVTESYRGKGLEPGSGWTVAADLQEILTSEQVEVLGARTRELRTGRRGGHRAPRADGGAGFRRRGFGTPGAFEEEPVWRRGPESGDALALTSEQRDRIRDIRESFGPQLEDLRAAFQSEAITREQAQARAREIRDALHEEISAILTDEQRASLAEHRFEAETRRDERQAAEHAAMVDALDLTSEQEASLEALRETFRTAGRPANEAEAEARREEHRTARSRILDAHQQEIWILHGVVVGRFTMGRARFGQGSEGRRLRRGGGFGGPSPLGGS